MPQYVLSRIADAVQGQIIAGNGSGMVSDILTDSRRLLYPEGILFFALVTTANNAHKYIPELYSNGVRYFVVQEDINTDLYPEAGIIKTKNTLQALQKLAAWHRLQHQCPVIGITGSNGKTIVKEWLDHLLQVSYDLVKSPKSFNSQVGVPLSVWQMEKHHTLGIFEAGISRPGEMENLETVIRPTIGILTHIGDAHDEGFRSKEEKLKEKLKLFSHSEMLICQDKLLTYGSGLSLPPQVICWSENDPEAALYIEEINLLSAAAEIKGRYHGLYKQIIIPFSDRASLDNAITSWLTVLHLELDETLISERFRNLPAIDMRLELKAGINGCSLINDSYSNDINSLQIALDFLKSQQVHHTSVVILSDLLQTGREESQLYREVSGILNSKNIQKLYGIGKNISHYKELFSIPEKHFFESTESFLQHFEPSAFSRENILLKGARLFGFERIAARLEAQSHGTVLEIHLSAAAYNFRYFKSLLKPGTKLMAMVKAFAYGSGSYEMAKMLQFHNVDYLAVAYADEGEELRKAGVHIPIMVMNPDEQVFEKLLAYDLEPEIYSLNQLEQLIRFADGRPVKVHVELDTGMHRLGFSGNDLDMLSELLHKHSNIKAVSIFSHLSASDEAQHDDFTRQQIRHFNQLSERLSAMLPYKPLRHILNTGGILRFPEANFDMVRLGIGLYGIDPSGEYQQQLETVFTLKTKISQIREVAANDSVGYARKAIEGRRRRIAVIAIGYADGLNRLLSNGRGHVMIRGKKAPVTGNICMDMTMVDVTDIDCREGDEVIVFGKNASIIELATQLGTIPYEVLTAISQRVRRVYLSE